MTPPSVPFSTWILAAFDPVLVCAALWLGWRADQAGKIVIAALAALGVALVVDAALGFAGLPTLAPLTRDGPALLPVRAIAALAWSGIGYGARAIQARRR